MANVGSKVIEDLLEGAQKSAKNGYINAKKQAKAAGEQIPSFTDMRKEMKEVVGNVKQNLEKTYKNADGSLNEYGSMIADHDTATGLLQFGDQLRAGVGVQDALKNVFTDGAGNINKTKSMVAAGGAYVGALGTVGAVRGVMTDRNGNFDVPIIPFI